MNIRRMMNSPHLGSTQLVAHFLAYALLPAVGFSCLLQVLWFVGTAVAEPTVTTSIPASEAFISVAKAAQPAVVNISSSRKVIAGAQQPPSPSPFFDDPFFRRFFGEEFRRRFQLPPERREQGLGSGVLVSPDGYIVTNNHVIAEAEEVTVLLADSRRFTAKVVATDPRTDVAVIKIDAKGLPMLPWGDSSRLQVGEMVLAVGNPFGLNQTVTMGIISAVGRAHMGIVDYEDFIQTDAAINPGNSGGALVNLKGELIGINTAIFSQSGGYMGIGFAIPSNMAKGVMQSLIKHGKVIRGWLGVGIQDLTEDLAKEFGVAEIKGALVSDVASDGPAAKAGLERGDVITSFNNVSVKDSTQLRSLVTESEPGATVTLTILRDKRTRDIKVTLGEQPKEAGQFPGKSSAPGRGDHALTGVAVEPLEREDLRRLNIEGGVAVSGVEQESPADRAGLREGDVIREINRKPIRSVEDFERLVRGLSSKQGVLMLIMRGKATLFLSIKPE
ncbi:MAG: serine protease Do [Nitrospira sp.]|nr:MAG: serine protease Do [Nitrospira sp.]